MVDREPIAIVGIGCRLPVGLDTPGELWQALLDGVDAVGEVPADRWPSSATADRRGGFLDDVAGFDAELFDISPVEARQMDPQQRMALEVAWSATEDARISPAGLAGTRTGVFFGAMWQEYSLLTDGSAAAIRAHSAVGWDNSVIPARIAYALGLRGPAMTVATASSSSLVAVHLAVQSLRAGESDTALAGGVNLMLHPNTSVAMAKLGTQSSDGRCRAFDADGDGYVRGEGCAVVVLRRLSDALANGDRIYAVVHGSAVNNDGASDGLTAPNPEAQVEVLRAAWDNAGLSPGLAAYGEAHGTGTPLGDVVEAEALGSVFGQGRAEPLRIGSAKTNFGHLEPAAGVLGLVKAALSIHHGEIPPSLHFRTPNPRIDFAANRLEVVTARIPWPEGPRFAGVSSFGFGGTNAHVALGQAPASEPAPPSTEEPVCLVVSGRTERALAENAVRLADHLDGLRDNDLPDIAYSLATTRAHLAVRGAVVAGSVDEAVEGLRSLAVGGGDASAAQRGKVVFVFPGQGAQWLGMGRALLAQSEVFADAVQACDAAMAPFTGWSVVALLRGDSELSLARTDVVQPALFAMYVGLAAVWRSWGVEPSAVVGHSQGEVAAAVVSGALSLEDGARVVAVRSRAVHERAVRGAMGLVERPVEEVRERLAPYGESLSVAVVNTARSTVVAGDEEAVDRFLAELEESGAFCQKVEVDYASHSPHMDALLPGLREDLSGITAGAARIPFYSSITGGSLSGPELDTDYWCRNLREPVRFDRACERLRTDGHEVFVEVSPHPVLAVALAQDDSSVVVGSLRRDRGGVDQLLRALGDLHVRGYPVDWERVHSGRAVDLPTYAFQRRRYWLDDHDDVDPVAERPTWHEEVAALPESERLPWLVDLVAREAAALLGRSAETVRLDVALREQGFDSLMVVELRNRLAARTRVELPTVLAFDYPTPRAIAALLGERTTAASPAPAPVRPEPDLDTDPIADPIAIVAMGCRLPSGIDTPEEFWELLAGGREAPGPFPERWNRWNLATLHDTELESTGKAFARKGGFVRDVEHFDASFFGLSPREAVSLDPQQRLVLEVVWEALERANLRPDSLAGSNTGVYLGAMSSDYDVDRRWDVDAIDGYKVTGNASSLISGRVAYTLGLAGPALTVDTACSSSLVALRLGCDALRAGECDLALVGGVTVMNTPQIFVEFSRLNGLARDGRCKSFSDLADGTSWAEGCGVLVLKRLSAAERDGDRVLAVVRGTAVNQDGRSQGLTAPNGLAQQRVVRDALSDARLTPADIDVIEAHATGTVLGDPIEANALAEVFSGRERPLYLGSCKSNLGHAQAAAGVIGVIKMVLALQHGWLPETLHVDRPSTQIDWAGSALELLRRPRPWPRTARTRRAGVNSFGISGTNAHVILEEAPAATDTTEPAPDQLAYPLLISGTDEPALRAQAARWAEWLDTRSPASLRDIARTAAVSRTPFGARGAVVAGSVSEAVTGLRALAAGDAHDATVTGTAVERGRVVFVFPGQGAQWLGMGRALLAQSEVFADAITACDAALARHTGWSIAELLREDSELSLARTDVVQPALFAMYVGLAAVWRSWGVEPSAVVGHSQGEVAAAVVSGALSLEDGARVVASRARAVREHAVPGAMGLVERPVEEVRERLAPYGESLSVAVVNTAKSTVVAGDEDAVKRFLAEMEELGAFCQKVDVDYASHSPHMDALLPGLREQLSGIVAGVAQIPFCSSVTGEPLSGPELDGDYWCRNLREPVRFDRALERLRADGHGVFVEVSPHPVLAVALAQDDSSVVVGSLRRDRGGIDQLWRALAELHVQGYPVDWDRVFGGRDARKADLPTYAFQRQRYWLDEPPRTTTTAAGQLPAEHPWIGAMTTLAGDPGYLFMGRLSQDEHPWLADHVVADAVLVPGAGLLDLALSAAHTAGAEAVAELALLEPLVLADSSATRLQATVGQPDARGRRPFTLHSQPEDTDEPLTWRQHVTGEFVTKAGANAEPPFEELRTWPVPGAHALDRDDFYSRALSVGLAYGPAFQCLRQLASKDGVYYGRVSLPESLDPAGYGLHPALLDAALQVVVAGLLESSTDSRPLVPFIWSDVELYRAGARELRVRVDYDHGGGDPAPATLWLADAAGDPVARIGMLKFQRGGRGPVEHLYRVDFETAPLEEATALTGTVVVGDAELGRALGVEAVSDLDALFERLGAGTDTPERLLFTPHDTADALRSVQRCLADPRLQHTELTWTTRDGVSSSPDDHAHNWLHASVWGLLRVVRTEQPDRVLRLVDLDSGTPDTTLLARVLGTRSEPEWVLRGGTALVPRVRPVRDEDDAPAVPSGCEAPGPGEVRVQVRAAGVNTEPGLEYAGVVRDVGPGVTHLRPGDRVMGLTTSTVAGEVRTDAATLVRIPETLTFAQAATVPVAFLTALHALDDLASLAPGERVLVHAADGDVGMAVVRLARLRGAEVFATASPGNRSALRALGLDDAHIRSAHDSAFEATVLGATGGRGMDVVVGAPAGGLTDAVSRLLARGGRVVSLDPRSAAGHPGVDHRVADVLAVDPARIGAMLSELAGLFARDALTPVPYTAYDVRHTPHALRRAPVEKCVVTMPRALDPDGTVLITGGLGELGGALAAHLVRVHGVRRLVLSSRRGADTPAADTLVRELEDAGAEQVRVVACDVAERGEVAALLDGVDPEHPLTAVFHLAGVLDDGLVQGFTEERLHRVMAPKVRGARHLDELTERLDLAAFVLYSSAAGTLGTAGQSGYAAANAALDALAANRRKRGLPGTSLAFGLWEQAGVGMTAHLGKAELGRLRRQGIGALSLDEGLRALDVALTRPDPYLVPVHLELASLRHALGDAQPPALLRALVRPRVQARQADAPVDETPLQDRMAGVSEPERLAVLVEVVRGEVAAVLGLPGPDGVPSDKALRSLGIDSLTMIELRKRLSKRANTSLPATLVFDYPTADAIAGLLLREGATR